MRLPAYLALALMAGPSAALAQGHHHPHGAPWNNRVDSGPDAGVPGWFYNVGTTGLRIELVGPGEVVWVDFSLPQQQANVSVGTQVTVIAKDLGTAGLPASIIARDPNINAQSRNLRFRAAADNTQAQLIPGTLVNVQVAVGSEAPAIVIPTAAVRRSTFGTSVFVLENVTENGEKKERARSRSVEVVGNSTATPEDLVVIESGLAPGERIAANGAFKLRDGALVNAQLQDPSISQRKVGM